MADEQQREQESQQDEQGGGVGTGKIHRLVQRSARQLTA